MADTMKKHFVTFYSPGTFVAETTERPIDAWDPVIATAMAKKIVERYGARPYGFVFTTRERGPDDLDSRQTARSGTYYLSGKVETLKEVKARKDPRDSTLIANMASNGWNRIITSTKGWKWTQPLEDGDVVLEVSDG